MLRCWLVDLLQNCIGSACSSVCHTSRLDKVSFLTQKFWVLSKFKLFVNMSKILKKEYILYPFWFISWFRLISLIGQENSQFINKAYSSTLNMEYYAEYSITFWHESYLSLDSFHNKCCIWFIIFAAYHMQHMICEVINLKCGKYKVLQFGLVPSWNQDWPVSVSVSYTKCCGLLIWCFNHNYRLIVNLDIWRNGSTVYPVVKGSGTSKQNDLAFH